MINYQLNSKHALVCGASKGIGRATAVKLAQSGAIVTALARSEDTLQKLMTELKAAGADCPTALVVDLHDRVAIREKVTPLITEKGPVHILVNNAGGPAGGPIIKAETDAFQAGLERHLFASQLLVQLLVPGMLAEGYGRIINIISTSVREPIPKLGVSNTVRGAMAGWAKSLARELPPKITINNILPGFTDTDRLTSLAQGRASREGVTVQDVHTKWMSDVPENRLARPDEVAAAICFLASQDAAFIRGTSIAVDGGRMRSI